MKKELVCEQRDGFWFYSIFCYKGALLKKEALFIDDSDTEKYVKYANEKKCNQVAIYVYNSNLNSLDFLNSMDSIEYLAIIGDARNLDCSPLYALKNLHYLVFSHPGELYLDRIEGLEFFSTSECENVKYVGKVPSLRTLSLESSTSKKSYADLSVLSELQSLEVLRLHGLGLVSLKGVGQFRRLKVLDLDGLKTLIDIENLSNIKLSLTSLRIYDCNQIENFESIASLRCLRFLSLDNMDHVPNLDFIAPLASLKTFISSNSNFVDANLTNLEKIETVVVFPIRKKYFVSSTEGAKRFKQREDFPLNRNLGEEEIEPWRRISY